MLYDEKKQPFNEADFTNPPAIYRGAPFWAWNCDLSDEDVDSMMEMFRDMGMGGAHLHSRTGMAMPYLKEEFMDRVSHAVESARKDGMYAWLYDEDRWPSGYGGGYITKEDRYRSRVLIFSPTELGDVAADDAWGQVANGKCARSNNRRLLNVYAVELDEDGWLKDYRVVGEDGIDSASPDTLWYAYLEISGKNPWFNDTAYANLLDPEAVREFIKTTHETYYRSVGADFGKTIPAIFTDEPQFSFKQNFRKAKDRTMVSIPFTDDLPDTYKAQFGDDLMAHLPELFFDKKEEWSVTRYRFHDHLTERFVSAYADQIGAWCRAHGIALTGHVMRESTLKLQSQAVGEAMRFYRSMDLPGIDMLAFRIEYNTAKQCQSAVHQFGREGMLSELYGVTNWDFDFRGHKVLGDWQAALGVTVRVPHLAWTSMAGEAKRDYPAAISYQSPWYREYKCVEDYFSRVNTAMTRGKCEVNLGVLHPIESYWLAYGSEEKTGRLRRELDESFDMLTGWLIGDTKDFDLIAESLIETLFRGADNGRVQIGEMSYSTILAPNMLTMRSSTLKMLRDFKNAGGRIVFSGYTPEYLDGMPSEEIKAFVNECEKIPFSKSRILTALEGVSNLDIFGEDGVPTDNLITQMRIDGSEKWIFVAHKPAQGQEKVSGADAYSSNNPRERLKKLDRIDNQKITLRIRGCWSAKCYDAWNGAVDEMPAIHRNAYTYIDAVLYGQDSLLLRLTPAAGECPLATKAKTVRLVPISYDRKVSVTLSEPNVLLLDMAEYAFDGGEWQSKEEILRLDNKFRDHLGWAYRMEAFPQPWVLGTKNAEKHRLSLRFTIKSEVKVENVELAMEHPETCEIIWNGHSVSNEPAGRYVDRDILRIALGMLPAGESKLIVHMPFDQKTDVEAMYLLGDFGVRIDGDSAVITKPVREIGFGDWVHHGLPFYGGNVTYHMSIEGEGDPIQVVLNRFRAPVIAVDLDGERQGVIAISPYAVTTKPLTPGTHLLDVTVYGNRFNTFGALHNVDSGDDVYCSPNFWRSTGSLWAYEYQLRSTGPLKSPDIYRVQNV